jgi:subtilisin family serine protease
VASACAFLVVIAPIGTAAAVGDGTAVPAPSSPTSTYVVEVKPGRTSAAAAAIGAVGATPDRQFSHAIDGFSVDLTPAQAAQLAAAPEVATVTADQTFRVASTEAPAPWGLDRLDQVSLPLDDSYTYPDSAGAGVPVYVVDTGVTPNPGFGNRLASGFTAFTDGYGTSDCDGHGTHVAGTVASTPYGVAKAATVVPVRVLDCSGAGSTTTVIAGLDWIAANHAPGTPGVVNLSMNGPLSSPLNAAVAGLIADGLTVVVAAGNQGPTVDACTTSPASAPAALTVGATGPDDVAAPFSDLGPCLDVFAPGVSIVSLDATNPAGSATMSGTSMAAPHVAGVAALYLGEYPAATPDQVAAVITGAAERVVTGAGATTTTELVSSDVLPPLGTASGLRITAATSTSLSVAWDPSPVGAAAQTYQLTYRQAGTTWRTTTPTTSTAATLSGLLPGTTYEIELTATNSLGTGVPSGPITGVTLPPVAAISLYVTSVYSHLFHRAPDPVGLATWTGALDRGTPRIAVANDITSSAEYRSGLITASYRTFLGRDPDPQGLQFWLGAMGGGLTIQQMEAGFVASPEFYQAAGGTPDTWVTSLYTHVLGRTPAPSEVAFWVARVAGGSTRTSVALGFLLSTEHLASVINGYYEDLLGRGIDPSGQSTWVAAIQRGTRIEAVIGAIIASPEYYSTNT